jgi:phenylpropionate dioxygenase-like ring-hydroxylating dioxygenase large terminal subunit
VPELTVSTLARLEAPLPSWHLLGRARDVPRGRPLSASLCGQDLALYRSGAGIAALGSRCPHMGADLARGCVKDGRLACPFHAWEFGADGRCARIPGQDGVPDFAQVPAYPVRERHGLVHVFRGARSPTFELPFFEGLDPDDFVVAKPFRVEANSPWYMIGVNGFDPAHFAYVHGRTPAAPHTVDSPHPAARRIVHRFKVTGSALQDRASRRLWGEEATLSFTSWNGGVIVGTMKIGGFTSYLIITVQALGPTRCAADFALFRPRRGVLRRLFRPLSMAILRRVTQSFFRHEVETVGQAHLNPSRLVAHDEPVRDYMNWLLGRAEAERPAARGRRRATADA